tara:strand:- start:1404 stop:2216 length:813 start_codon:yes stop_codon:yes gene_type:complete
MKFKNLLEAVGIHKPTRRHHYFVDTISLDDGTSFQFARWLHPSEAKKQFSVNQINSFKALISEGDFCIDIGAHTGDSALPMAVAAGSSGAVLALEPNPFVYHVLEKTARSNTPQMNIITMMAAATEEEGPIEFEYSDSGYCNGGRHEGMNALQHGHMFKLQVTGINLTQELNAHYSDLLPDLKFIKIDAEGYDLFVIKSLAEIILEYRPFIKSEVFKRTDSDYRKELFSFFLENQYAVHLVEGDNAVKGQPLTLSDIDIEPHYDILCSPC